jgi:pimeloyl-ACP methyl ester carboxylesterase
MDALRGSRFELAGVSVGRFAVYAEPAQGSVPLLLVHSVNAAASAAEVRPLFEHYARSRAVYALELPGFGASERTDRVYSPRLMTDALLLCAEEIARRHGGQIDALAVSLSSEFLARAATERPALFRSVALVSPTGWNRGASLRGPAESTRLQPAVLKLLRGPGWGRALFRGLTQPRVIRYFLQRTWGSHEIDEALWQYDVLITQQKGAEHAPLYFVSGGLFSADIRTVYEALAQPVWVGHGVRGDFTDYGGLDEVRGRPHWHIRSFQTGALPYFERLSEFCSAYDAFSTGLPGADQSGRISAKP